MFFFCLFIIIFNFFFFKYHEHGRENRLIKNSWGPGWGQGGYVAVVRNTQSIARLFDMFDVFDGFDVFDVFDLFDVFDVFDGFDGFDGRGRIRRRCSQHSKYYFILFICCLVSVRRPFCV